MNLGNKVRSGVKWLLVGNTGNHILRFMFGVVLARLLVPADFGMIVTIQIFTGFVGMLAAGGMGQALIRAKEANENDFNAVFTLQLAIGILVYLGFFLSAPWIAEYFGDPLYEPLLQVSAISFLMRPFGFMRISWLNREMAFKKRAVVEVSVGLVTGVSSILMALAGMGVWSLTLSGLVAGLFRNILLIYLTPLMLHLNFDLSIMRRHGSYGFKITANDFISYLKRETANLIISKSAGPAFLGIFNKGDSLSRLPNRLLVPPVGQTVFRAMSKVQDDLDQSKYMFYKVITLLMVYTTPLYVGLWWVAEPFIGVVYGENWLPAAGPLEILVMVGICRNIGIPCGVLLAAQDRLVQELYAQIIGLVFLIIACFIGLEWGLEGVAWGVLASHIFGAVYFYILAYHTIPTKIADLIGALVPGLLLNSILFVALAITHWMLGDIRTTAPALYLLVMVVSGAAVYLPAFLFLPIPSLKSEADRWRQKINGVLSRVSKA